jgi:hypothetical protein
VQVADEQGMMKDGPKAPGELFRRVGRAVKVPEVFDLVRVEPRLDVAEQAAVDLQVGLQPAHEVEDGGAVTLTNFFIGVEAQANVVVAPDAHNLDLPKQANRFLYPLAHLENVAEDHEALGPVLLEHGESLAQFPGVFVDVGQ